MPDENMGCGCGCQDCECKEVNVCEPTQKVDANLRDKLMVFKDYVCTIALTPCSQLGKVMSKVVYYLWCMLKDLVNMVINNRKRTETLMENDEYFCGRMSATSEWTERVNQISISNNQKILNFVSQFGQLAQNTNKTGYLSKPLTQSLIFKDEPSATITKVSGSTKINNRSVLNDYTVNPGAIDAVWETDNVYLLEKNKPVTVTYENLQNSFLNGVKIEKVEYIYTLNSIANGDKTAIGFYTDPTKTTRYLERGGASIKMQVKFYDGFDKLISPLGSVISFASLNTADFGNDFEAVSGVSGIELVKINGSSIDVVNGVAKAKNGNESKNSGSDYNSSEWDVDGSPLEYYGAIAGEVVSEDFSFNIETKNRGNVWFMFNSNVKAPVIIKPTLEPLPVFPYECNIKHFEC